ncbi:hypothetical protein CVT26_010227 [Gymnopilus dilepis]|uniref:Uncharacterized protein n=1 Tax=Gymnopilus dilepis TaxID=231916 RepID=A0A409X4A8_9AGAR|nr:hypothetical protein CVT26_010227 [Gymnopilus dilepis]
MHPEVLKDFSRIIVEFADADMKSKASLELAQRIWYDLCNNVAPKGMTIVGAELSSAKNLVLSITPPASAVCFMESDIQNQLQLYLIHILEAPQNVRIWVYPDQRWPRVIIHHVPIISTFLREEDALTAAMWELTNYNPAI